MMDSDLEGLNTTDLSTAEYIALLQVQATRDMANALTCLPDYLANPITQGIWGARPSESGR